MTKRIVVRFIGSAADKQDVRLSEFIEQLRGIKSALRENERIVSGEDEPALDYKIVELRHNSPSEMELEPVSLRPVPKQYESRVVASFGKELSAIRRRGKPFHAPELSRLEAYQTLGVQKSGALSELQISVGNTKVQIDDVFKKKLENILGPDEIIRGSISGFLEAVNIHNTNRFTLYPTLGPKKVTGKFHPAQREAIRAAIGNFVTVRGKLAYKTWSPFAHAVNAEAIEIHKPDAKLPTLFDLRGAMPKLTGKENSVAFVERLRHEDW